MSWGGAGGTRGVEQPRLVTIELDMVPIRFAVHISNPWLIKDGKDIDTEQNRQSAAALLDNLAWWTSALKTARQSTDLLACRRALRLPLLLYIMHAQCRRAATIVFVARNLLPLPQISNGRSTT